MAYILAQKEAEKTKLNSRSQNSEQHPVDAFLVGIAQSLKSLDPIRLLAAKGKIFNIVQECELQQLNAYSQQRNDIAYIYPASSVQTSSHITLSQEGVLPNFPDYVASTPTSDAMISDDDPDLTYFQM